MTKEDFTENSETLSKKLGEGSSVINLTEQLNYLDGLFSSGLRLTEKQIQEKLQEAGAERVSQATVYRRLQTLKKMSPLTKDEQSRYYYSSNKTLMIPAAVISSENIKVIKILNNLMESIKGSPIYEDAKNVVDKLSGLIKDDSKNFSSRVIFLGAPSSEVLPSVWSEIYHAMEINYPIVISYKKVGKSECESYGVQPYQLIFDNGIWDLWGYSLRDKKRKQFNLSRIKEVTIRKDSQQFNLPEDFDFYNQTPGTFGCYRDPDGKMVTYRIWLRRGSYAETYARERVWGENPATEETEDGTIIQFDDNQYAPILRWVLGWGRDVIPLMPEKLVLDWKSEIQDMIKNASLN